jgi:hypothetical protein
MKQDRFLLGIVIGIAVIALAAVAIFMVRQPGMKYGSEDTPAGVMQNYVLALVRGDNDRAYSYLAEGKYKPDRQQFQVGVNAMQYDFKNVSLKVGKADIFTNEAIVDIQVRRAGGGPFNDVSITNETSRMVFQNGVWKVASAPMPYWFWDWYQNTAPVGTPSPSN